MEIGKMEKVDLQNISIRPNGRSPLRPKIEGMMVGEAFTVAGVERGSISGIIATLSPKKFVTRKIAVGSFRVIRVS